MKYTHKVTDRRTDGYTDRQAGQAAGREVFPILLHKLSK